MWNKSKSLTLSIFCTRLFLVLLAVSLFTAPLLVRWYFGDGPWGEALRLPICVTFYLCAAPGFALLFCLHRLLKNLRRQEVFVEGNTKLLRAISWCCIAVGLVMLGGSWFYPTFLVVAVASAFFGLMLRVVKNVFEQAVELKAENDYTI